MNGPSSSYQLQVERSGPALREQILNLVRSRRDASERYSAVFRRKLPEYYDLWRGFTTGNFTPTKNNVWLPLIYSTIWSDVARKVATAFAQWPVLSCSGYGPADRPIAQKQEALLNAQLSDVGLISKEITTFLCADLYGTAISQTMWDHKEEIRNSTVMRSLPLSGEIVRTMQRQRVVTFDGPNHRNLDLLDFYPQPGFKELNGPGGMQWCLVRYYLDLDDCRFLASEAGGFVFDPAEVRRLSYEDSNVNVRPDESLLRRFEARLGVSPSRYGVEAYTRPVEIIEMWGHVPSEFAFLFGGSTNVVISIANDRYIFRASDNPFEHRNKPFIKFSPTHDPHYFYAPGKAEITAQSQIAANRFINHQLDGADIAVHPMFVYNANMGVNPRSLWAGPGRLFRVEAPPGTDVRAAISPLQMDMRGVQMGGEMVQVMSNYIQQGSAVIEDTVMGLAGSDRQTAREFLGRREASGTRLMLESVVYDNEYLEVLGNHYLSMDTQFLELDREVLILGDAALNDPETGAPINSTRHLINGEVLANQYAVRANGTTMSLSRESEKANLLTLTQILLGASANPAVAGAVNMVNYLRTVFHRFGFKDVNDVIAQNPAVQTQLAAAGIEGGVNAVPGPNDQQGLLQILGGGVPSGPISGVPAMAA